MAATLGSKASATNDHVSVLGAPTIVHNMSFLGAMHDDSEAPNSFSEQYMEHLAQVHQETPSVKHARLGDPCCI